MNPTNKYEGAVKFYSKEKGFGFIGSKSPKLSGDTWFHITEIQGENPPEVGDKVTFSISNKIKKGRHSALKISIKAKPPKPKKNSSLSGFPCVRGGSVGGCILNKDLGHIESSSYFYDAYATKLEAQNALISLAKSKGANAILYYRWTVVKDTGYLIWQDPSRFSAEGNAVLLTVTDR